MAWPMRVLYLKNYRHLDYSFCIAELRIYAIYKIRKAKGILMKSIGIIVCNYNKKDYVMNCVQSLFNQTISDFDIYVVDNASTDGSAEAISSKFGNKVNLLLNKENMGGSGGFNTGLREALKRNYEYLMCVDNDVIFDSCAVELLRDFLTEHEDIGVVGSKAYFMDDPKRIWSFSADIDFDRYVQIDNYRNCTDADNVPEIVYCTYVPACAMMLRTSAVRKVGIMPEENFIYWDDMEWGYRFNKAGYKVAAYGKAKVWHKGGGRNGGTTFNNYYLWRNRIQFFLKILPVEERERFAEVLLSDLFRLVYSCNLKSDIGVIKTVMHSFNDAVNGITGKAPEYKIYTRQTVGNRTEMALRGAKNVLILYNDDMEGLGNIIRNIRSFAPTLNIAISVKGCRTDKTIIQEQYTDCAVSDEYMPEQYDKHLVMCEHIFKITADMPQDFYIDTWCNIIYNEEDFAYANSFEQMRKLFVLCKKELLLRYQH